MLLSVAHGKLNKQVAAELGVSEVMIKVHRANGMRKMHVASLAKLVRVIDQLGVEPGDTPVRDSKSVAAPRKAPSKDHVQPSGRDPHMQARTKR